MSTPTGYRVQDPSTDQVVETFPALADGEVDQVLAAAETAQRAWAARPIEERATIVQRVADLFEERKDELAQIIATEMGKRVTEGVEEAEFSSAIFGYFADKGPTLAAELLTPLLQLFDDTFRYNAVLNVTRAVCSVLMLAGLVAVWWIYRPREGREYGRDAVAGTTAAYAVAFATNAVTLPWYYASIISLAGAFRPPVWVQRLTVGASIIVALAFQGSGNHRLYDAWFLALATIAAVVAVEWLFRDTPRMPSPERGELPHGPFGRAEHPQDAPAATRPA